jgi:hypothetical protein
MLRKESKMAYFPNGTSGMDYVETYCSNCINYKDNGTGSEGCAIFDLHLLWNYDACNGKTAVEGSQKHTMWLALEHFIPTTKNGLGAEQCKMFHPIEGVEQVVDKTEALKEWEAIYGKRTE